MTSGIPFSRQEIDYVKQHSPNEFPSIIARGLATKFREYNGGSRSTKAVALLMKQIHEGTIPPDPPTSQKPEPAAGKKPGKKLGKKVPV